MNITSLTRPRSRRLGTLAVLATSVVLAGTVLAGCSVAVADPARTPAAETTSARPAASQTPDAAPSSPAATDDAVASLADPAIWEGIRRSDLQPEVTQTFTCVDGAFTVDNNSDGMIVEVTGDCSEVTVRAHAGAVLLPQVDQLIVESDGSVIIAASATEVTLGDVADTNVVGWESGTPVVRDGGVANVTLPVS